MRFAWEGRLQADDQPISWEDIPHYKNLYTHTSLGAESMTIRHEDQHISLDLKRGRR